jgi:hypothetical protein
MYADLADHPFAMTMGSESYESPSERSWLKWAAAVEALMAAAGLGNNLDGDQDTDGFSTDDGHAAWEEGVTPADYLAEIGANRLAIASKAEA